MENDILYVVEHTSHGEVLRTYQGMSQDVVSQLVSEGGNAFDFVTEAEFAVLQAAAPKLSFG